MSDELRPAVVICHTHKCDIVPRILLFDDHNDAWTAARALGRSKQYREVYMCAFEHYSQGRLPADVNAHPDQLSLFDEVSP